MVFLYLVLLTSAHQFIIYCVLKGHKTSPWEEIEIETNAEFENVSTIKNK